MRSKSEITVNSVSSKCAISPQCSNYFLKFTRCVFFTTMLLVYTAQNKVSFFNYLVLFEINILGNLVGAGITAFLDLNDLNCLYMLIKNYNHSNSHSFLLDTDFLFPCRSPRSKTLKVTKESSPF